jgi:hypothetical protein
MDLNLAGWRVALHASPPELETAIARRYAPFRHVVNGIAVDGVDDTEADLTVEVLAEACTSANASLLQAELMSNGDKFLLDGPGFCGMIEPSRGHASLRMRSDAAAREIEYFLRMAVALFAYGSGGLLVHGAALKADAGTYLFIGQSGSGKSTLVSLSRAGRRASALGDDLILLRREDAGWRAFGTPFWNPEAADRDGQVESGRIRAIYKLVQDPDVFLAPMSAAAATAELLANCPIVNSQPALLAGLLDRCREIAATVGVERLHFRKDDSFWDVISAATGH